MSVAEPEMTLSDYGRVVARRKFVVVAATLLCAVVALAMVAMQTPIYSASSQVLVQPRGQDGLFENQVVNLNDRAIQTEIQVIEGQAVRQRVQQNLGLGELPPEVDATAAGDADVITLAVKDPNASNAAIYADAYAAAYIDVRREQAVSELLAASTEVQKAIDDLQAEIDSLPEGDARAAPLINQMANFNTTLDQLRVDAALRTGGAAIIKSATVSASPVEPTPARTVVLAAVVGLLIGLGAAFLLDYLDDKVRTDDDLEALTDSPMLAIVPVDPPPDHWPIAISEPGHAAVESFRGLRTNLQFLGLDREINVVQLTSSMAGEGKTTIASNLAVVLAQAGHRVAIVDADLRRPRLHEVFNVPQVPGLTELLIGEEPKNAVRQISVDDEHRLSVYPSGRVTSSPSEMLSSRRTSQLLKSMGSHYDYVIVDSAPILPVSDSVALATSVDGVLVIVHSGRVTRDQVGDTLQRLDRVGASTLGTVLNRADKQSAGYYQYGGYRPPPTPGKPPARDALAGGTSAGDTPARETPAGEPPAGEPPATTPSGSDTDDAGPVNAEA